MNQQTFSEYLSEPKRPKQAHLAKRIAAYLVDHLFILMLIIPFSLPLVLLDQLGQEFSWVYIAFVILFSFLATAYLFLKDGWKGHGIGKRLFHLQVIRLDTHQPIGFGTAALRYLMLRLLSLVEIVFICIQPNHRGIGDWMMYSMVIDTNEK